MQSCVMLYNTNGQRCALQKECKVQHFLQCIQVRNAEGRQLSCTRLGSAFSCAILHSCIIEARGFTGLDGEWYTHAQQSMLPCNGNIISAQSKQLADHRQTIGRPPYRSCHARYTGPGKANKLTRALPLALAGASPGVAPTGEAGRGRAVALARATALGNIMADILFGISC